MSDYFYEIERLAFCLQDAEAPVALPASLNPPSDIDDALPRSARSAHEGFR